jgi:hypothetical protein
VTAPMLPAAPTGASSPLGVPNDPSADPAQAERLARLFASIQGARQDAAAALPGGNDPAAGAEMGRAPESEPAPGPKPLTVMALPTGGEARERALRAVRAVYGDQFPLLEETPDDDQWADWAHDRWEAYEGPHTPAVHRARRNRLLRTGTQWISSFNGGPWRPPPRNRDRVRAVVNVIGPALDYRLQQQTSQRPGVRVLPRTPDPDDQKKATASQKFLEYQHAEQKLQRVRRVADYWAQTDGVSFLYTFWDPAAGPMSRDASGQMLRLGDARTTVLQVEQVRVSPNATVITPPLVWVVNEDVPEMQAVAEYGARVLDQPTGMGARGGWSSGATASDRALAGIHGRAVDPTTAPNLRGTRTVQKLTIFCEPTEILPNGLTLVVVGRKVVFLWGLLCGCVPLVPNRDGSSDPAFYPRPIMDDWIEEQMRLNAAYSLLVNNLRVNSGGRFFARHGAIRPDALLGGQDLVVEVRSQNPLSDVLAPMPGMSIGEDALRSIEMSIKRLEDLSGYNDTARGAVSQDSGRAILANREQLEQVFAPPVWDGAEAVKGWSRVTLAWGAAFWDVPRAIRAVGRGRPDLGRTLSSQDLDGTADIDLNPETMMPVPSSVKRFQLDDWLNRGLITKGSYMRRYPTGFIDDLEEPDEVHSARAYRFVDAVKNALPPEELLWQDDEAIWQDVLDRELILAPEVPPAWRAAGLERWDALAQQALEKSQATQMGGLVPSPFAPMDPERGALAPRPMQPPPGAPAGAPGMPPDAAPADGSVPPAAPPDPATAPTLAMPSGPGATEPLLQQQTMQTDAARAFERSAVQ